MGFGFRKSIKIAPGIRMNVSSGGVGVSAGVKGLRASVGPRGTRVTASIPGTGISYTTTSGRRQYKSSAHQRRNELVRMQREIQKMQELENAKLQVEEFENRIELIKSIHKECDEEFNWEQLKDTPPPFEKGQKGLCEIKALKALDTYKPNFIVTFLRLDKKKIKELEEKLVTARKRDEEEYVQWEQLIQTAHRIKERNLDAYLEVIEDLSPLDDLTEFGSGFEFTVEHPDYLEVNFEVNAETTVPTEAKTLTKTGKLSVKNMTKTQYFDLYQDYVCSCVIRIARDMFAILPIKEIYIHALEEKRSTQTGNFEKNVILSVRMQREEINLLNFEHIDCSDSMNNFEHSMKFKKTAGFDSIDPLIPAQILQ